MREGYEHPQKDETIGADVTPGFVGPEAPKPAKRSVRNAAG